MFATAVADPSLATPTSAASTSGGPTFTSTRTYAFQLPEALARGGVVVDIRSQAQRQSDGTLPGALAIDSAVLAQRVNPASGGSLALAVDRDVEWILVSSEGATSSHAAAALRQLGLHRATDVVGGYRAIKAAGSIGSLMTSAHCTRELATVAAH